MTYIQWFWRRLLPWWLALAAPGIMLSFPMLQICVLFGLATVAAWVNTRYDTMLDVLIEGGIDDAVVEKSLSNMADLFGTCLLLICLFNMLLWLYVITTIDWATMLRMVIN